MIRKIIFASPPHPTMARSANLLDNALRWRWLPHVLSIGLFAYAAMRANLVGLTFDEICSLPFIREFSTVGITRSAQVHLLNAWLLHFITPRWGETETVVRLPSLLSMIIYLWAAVALSKRLPHPFGLARFILLTMIPFVIDFFSLSRGYGEGLAFMLAALLFAVRFEEKATFGYALAAIGCSALSVIASYTQLNTFLPILLLIAWRILSDSRPWTQRLIRLLGVGIPAGTFLAILLPTLFELSGRGEFFFGGRNGFWSDTAASLGRCFAYYQSPSGLIANLYRVVFLIAVASALMLVTNALRSGQRKDGFVIGAVLLIGIASPIAQFLLLGTNLPVERTALFYYPLIGLALSEGLAALGGIWSSRISFTLCALFALHFILTMNVTRTYSWRFESGSRAVIEQLQQKGSAGLRVGADYIHMPSLNYHKTHLRADVEVVEISGCWNTCLGLEELDPYYFGSECAYQRFDRQELISMLGEDLELFYLDRTMIKELDRNQVHYELIQVYPASRTSLIRLER